MKGSSALNSGTVQEILTTLQKWFTTIHQHSDFKN
jgi:hypothetical protein